MRRLQKAASLLTVIVLCAAVFSSCSTGNLTETESPSEQTDASVGPEASEPAGNIAAPELSETIERLSETEESISIWTTTLMSIELNTSSINELTAIQEYEKKTGVHIDWHQASSAGAAEQFGIMMSSGEYCDMVFGLENYYTGGVSGALNEQVILALDDLIPEYAPHYLAFITSEDEIYKEVRTDDGRFLALYSVYGAEYTPISGPMVRSDWLEALELDAPVTYDDYFNVGKAFLTEYGCRDPIAMLSTLSFSASQSNTCGYLSGGYGVIGFSHDLNGAGAVGLYNDKGTVRSTLLEPGYRNFLEMLRQWYSEGVIGRDFISNPNTTMSPNYIGIITSENTGIFCGDAVNMDGYCEQSGNPNFKLTAAPAAKISAGDPPNAFGIDRNRKQGSSAVITSDCENVKLALKWLDNWFTEEGATLANYGVDGLANEIGADGVRRYTELVLNNPDGLSQMAATVIYTVTFIPTILTQETRFSIWPDHVLDAVKVWNDSVTGEGILPGVSPTTEEAERYSSIATVVQTFASENVIKFVTGDVSFDRYDDFLDELKELGIEECIAIYQAALERYNAR